MDTNTKELREKVRAEFAEQIKNGVLRNEIARSLRKFGFSFTQVGLLMEVNAKTAYAMCVSFTKDSKKKREEEGHLERKEIKNFLKGISKDTPERREHRRETLNLFVSLVGKPKAGKVGKPRKTVSNEADTIQN